MSLMISALDVRPTILGLRDRLSDSEQVKGPGSAVAGSFSAASLRSVAPVDDRRWVGWASV